MFKFILSLLIVLNLSQNVWASLCAIKGLPSEPTPSLTPMPLSDTLLPTENDILGDTKSNSNENRTVESKGSSLKSEIKNERSKSDQPKIDQAVEPQKERRNAQNSNQKLGTTNKNGQSLKNSKAKKLDLKAKSLGPVDISDCVRVLKSKISEADNNEEFISAFDEICAEFKILKCTKVIVRADINQEEKELGKEYPGSSLFKVKTDDEDYIYILKANENLDTK